MVATDRNVAPRTLIVLLGVLILGACGSDTEGPATAVVHEENNARPIPRWQDSPVEAFQASIPAPRWFGRIDAPVVNDIEDVGNLWRSEKRCCDKERRLQRNNRIFYKACYNAILAHPADEALVVKCLWLMDAGADAEQVVAINGFLVDNFSHHRNSVDNCSNCMPADTVARATLSLARQERHDADDRPRSIRRLERLLDERLPEISLWVQAEIYAALGRWYDEEGFTAARRTRFLEAYHRLDRERVENEALDRRFRELRSLLEDIDLRASADR